MLMKSSLMQRTLKHKAGSNSPKATAHKGTEIPGGNHLALGRITLRWNQGKIVQVGSDSITSHQEAESFSHLFFPTQGSWSSLAKIPAGCPWPNSQCLSPLPHPH